jgi:RecA-family ATPase
MDTYDPDLAVGKLRVLAPRTKPNGAAAAPIEPLPYIDMSSWDANSAPEREWAVENRIPMYQPHLTTGHGAIGKSLLELQRAVAHVLGKRWLGMSVRQGPVVYLGAEDEADELHRRLEDILRHYNANFKDIVGGLHLLSYVGEDCLLGVADSAGIIRPTDLFHRLLTDATRIKPVSLTIDTLTDVYAGNEIDRNQTTQFVKLLQHMAIKARCSVAILAHPSNAGMATGSGLSGSTGWHNKVRSRLYMRSPTTAKGEEIDSAHGPASAPKAEVTAIREYLEDLTRAVSAATEKTGNQFAFDQITELVKADLRPKYGQWGEFDNWMMMNVDRILLEQRLGY